MQKYFDSWRRFINYGIIKEMLWVYNNSKSKKIYDLLSDDIKNRLSKLNGYSYDNFDFGFENYNGQYKSSEDYKKLVQGQFLIPANGELYFCDTYSQDDDFRISSEKRKIIYQHCHKNGKSRIILRQKKGLARHNKKWLLKEK